MISTRSAATRLLSSRSSKKILESSSKKIRAVRHLSSTRRPAYEASLWSSNHESSSNDQFKSIYFLTSALSALGLGGLFLASDETSTTFCSGILGVVGKEGSSQDFFIRGLDILQKRGYDGVGIASMDKNQKGIVITKQVVTSDGAPSNALNLVRQHYDAYPTVTPTGMAHTRWATHGAKIQESNVHPHLDASGKIALIHNGSIINARELRDDLKKEGYTFDGQSDSEVLAKLIGHYYAQKNTTIKEATQKALSRCLGTWGICLLCSDNPEELVVATHGSPLFIGLGDDRIFVASEVSAFSKWTKNYIAMKDGEIGILDADGGTLDLTRKEESPLTEEQVLPPEFPHWTIKEILEQPNAVGRALAFGARLGAQHVHLGGLDSNEAVLRNVKHMALVGTGSSLHAARYGERLFKHIAAVPGRITAMDAVETEYHDLASSGARSAETGIIALTQSGETSDIKKVVADALEEGFTTIGVVNTVGSLVARMVKMGVYCHAGNENGVASTKSFTAQVTVLGLVAIWFRELQDRMRGVTTEALETERLKEALLRLPISLGMALKTRDQCKQVAERLNGKEHCFVLGRGKY